MRPKDTAGEAGIRLTRGIGEGDCLGRTRAKPRKAVGMLKCFKRIALRCEKTERNLASLVVFTASMILVKPVHTASSTYTSASYIYNRANS